MSELENIKPVAFYRADWKGDMMFRKDNTVVIRKNEGDFTTGWIKPLYDELPEPQSQLTIPKSIADLLDKFIEFVFEDIGHEEWWIQENGLIEWFSKTPNCYIKDAYLAGKALGVDLVKVVADENVQICY
ncbi:hypothetical protein Tempeh6L_06735 [Lactococcus lactis subsp. lactis]|uniref:hypothetical protein n=1 Tax=Lactococcus lactis TaxID=1358 RepID=UPI000A4B873A|nr:hypothetical protein [Lactococcus lactis]